MGQSPFALRWARPEDCSAIRQLIFRSFLEAQDSPRGLSPETLARRVLQRLDRLEELLVTQASFLVLVAVAPSGALAGCLLLDVEDIDRASGEPQAFIIYLAVAPPWRDGRLAKRLVRHAAHEAYKRGCRYLAAEVGLGPHGQLKTTQWLGFKPERCIVSIPCTPQGLPPAPGAKALQG